MLVTVSNAHTVTVSDLILTTPDKGSSVIKLMDSGRDWFREVK